MRFQKKNPFVKLYEKNKLKQMRHYNLDNFSDAQIIEENKDQKDSEGKPLYPKRYIKWANRVRRFFKWLYGKAKGFIGSFTWAWVGK